MDSYQLVEDLPHSPEELELDLEFDYATPAASSDAGTVSKSDDLPKKKRKAWGQPVPEIVPILPPRKRAKTAEEKEQRKNERILRNRRAADKSRQRQKAAQAELEQQNKDLLVENAQLRDLLKQHGLMGEYKPPIEQLTPPASVCTATPSVCDLDTTQDDLSQLDDSSSHQLPIFSFGSTSCATNQQSPTLTPTLDLGKEGGQVNSLSSGMTQYPAAILCDLQCQPEVLATKLRSCLSPNLKLHTVLTFLHYLTIAKSFSTGMLCQMSHLFRTLEEMLTTTCSELECLIASNFQLIHILISMPATSTQPAVFRLKLLSRLLACNPSLAPLLKTAADRALQQNLEVENWTANADLRWAVSSLMTIKWSINWLEQEHAHLRLQLRKGSLDRDVLFQKEKTGVDCGAVEKNYRLFDAIDPKPWIHVEPGKVSSHLVSTLEVH